MTVLELADGMERRGAVLTDDDVRQLADAMGVEGRLDMEE